MQVKVNNVSEAMEMLYTDSVKRVLIQGRVGDVFMHIPVTKIMAGDFLSTAIHFAEEQRAGAHGDGYNYTELKDAFYETLTGDLWL